MVIIITVIVGLVFITAQIIFYETLKEINKIKLQLEPLWKDGGMYPKSKPIEVGKLTRTLWVKPAPLYHVISK